MSSKRTSGIEEHKPIATRIDADTILLRQRAEGPGGLKGDFAKRVKRGEPGWEEAVALLEKKEEK